YPRLLSHAKGIVVNAYRSYYINFDRDDIQYNPACARYDPDLFYTLKPGSCTFANREFSVEYRINSLGGGAGRNLQCHHRAQDALASAQHSRILVRYGAGTANAEQGGPF